MNLKKDAQVPVSIALRTAIWNWIELCPEEFNEALLSHRRLEGAPERVYDLLFDLQENTRDKAGAWPTLAVLLSISYDRMKIEYETNAIGAHKTTYRKVKPDHHLTGSHSSCKRVTGTQLHGAPPQKPAIRLEELRSQHGLCYRCL